MSHSALKPSQQASIWAGWADAQSITDIQRSTGHDRWTILQLLYRSGGIRPAPRKRSARALADWEREEISRELALGSSFRDIATTLQRAPSTISREVNRHGGRRFYRAKRADAEAWENAKRPKRCLLSENTRLRRLVTKKLKKGYSPEQISGWLKRHHDGDQSMQVSHETIYKTLFVQSRGALKKELTSHLRTRRQLRKAKKASPKGQSRGQIIDAVSIRERPADVEDRAVPGHWEGDLIAGSKNSYIATLVERQTRFVMLVKVEGKKSDVVVKALSRNVKKLPAQLKKSLTWDRGMELAKHKKFTIATAVDVYFCDPHSPWQRGSNENTNGLLREYFPKGTDLSEHTQADLNKVALLLNTRPRKTLGFMTPGEKLNEVLR